MKNLFLILAVLCTLFVNAQEKYITRTGHIWFFSSAPLEDIEAHNRQSTVMLIPESGEVAFKVVMKSFEFEKALMQEHFNENYVDSDKYPNATFDGTITNLDDIDFSKDGEYTATIKGKLTIKGVTKEIEETGTITVKGGEIDMDAEFNIKVADFDIKIPAGVSDNISETIKITVDATLTEFKR